MIILPNMKSIIGNKISAIPQKIIVGGDFTDYNGTTQNRITRLNSNGAIDTGFTIGTGFDYQVSGFTYQVYAIAIQSDGKIVVGGGFLGYNGAYQAYITRLNSNGIRDTGFTIGTGFNGEVYAIAIQSDGKIVVGGTFAWYNGSTSQYIAKLNSDGTHDTGFGGTGFNFPTTAIAIQSDGNIVIGGNFKTYNGTVQNHITRVYDSGDLDGSFTIGTGFNTSAVLAIAIQSDGKIVVGGTFTTYNGTAQSRITRLNSDGTMDLTWGAGFDYHVHAIAIQSDGKIVVGGAFTSYITRLNSDGTSDTDFTIGTGFDGTVKTIAIQSDGKIVVGGAFTSYNGTNQNCITRLNSNGTLDTGFTIGTGFNSTVNSVMLT
jgi:uncharacterized delta-60 repeat protein